MQPKGCRSEATMARSCLIEDTAKRITARKVSRIQKPKRQKRIHQNNPNAAPKTTPKTIKGDHIPHPNKESPAVRRIVKTGSCFRTKLLSTKSKRTFTANRESPSRRLKASQLTEPKSNYVESPMTPIQSNATPASVFLKVGRKKSEE